MDWLSKIDGGVAWVVFGPVGVWRYRLKQLAPWCIRNAHSILMQIERKSKQWQPRWFDYENKIKHTELQVLLIVSSGPDTLCRCVSAPNIARSTTDIAMISPLMIVLLYCRNTSVFGNHLLPELISDETYTWVSSDCNNDSEWWWGK